MRWATLALVAAVVVISWADAVRAEDPPLVQALALSKTIQQAARQVEPSVACILISRSDEYRRRFLDSPPSEEPGRLGTFPPRKPTGPGERDPRSELRKLDLSDPDNVPESFGSGVVIDEKGLILTNYHVIRDATKIYVRLPGDKASYADIHAADPRSDLAILRLTDPSVLPVPAVKMGDGGAVEKGQWVLSLANPFAAGFRDGSPSVSWGIISNLRRRARGSAREEDRSKTLHHFGTLIQTDARLNLGVSGGALINLRGEMIGLTTALAALSGSETAGGFAIPMDAGMRRIVDVLKRGEEVEYGFLGITLSESRRSQNGVQILQTTPGSPAFLAGLQPGDSILTVNGTPVHENDDLFLALGTVLAGSEARLEVRTGTRGPTRGVNLVLAKFFVPGKIIASKKPPFIRGIRVDYTSVLMMMHSSVAARLRPNAMVQAGVFIRDVVADSPAASIARLREGEVITHVNGTAVSTPAEFYREAQKVRTGEPLQLTLAPTEWGKPPPKVTLN